MDSLADTGADLRRARGFPHSDIPGYGACTRLPGAYRSVPRPSSALDAKASTVRP
jgi:hypothetical protein